MENHQSHSLAPPLDTTIWFNTPEPLTLEELRGKVVVIHAFQMLCPGCVFHGLPQAKVIDRLYPRQEVQVIGLHTVFEHHDVMTSDALTAFIHEYRIPFPIAIDRPSDKKPIPHTMASYQMQGTPTLIVIDKNGRIRLNHFGRISDIEVGSIIGGLLEEKITQ
ncbi:redoxin family protein [Amphritea sp.]|uniref:redoxin family protein n=1 Tax=Amphritea sp. TaxID=1872502 RepID=UPI0025B81C16|nr:redoxin family protein [Amphritea sp.]